MCGLTAIYHSDSCSLPSADELVGMLDTSLKAIDHRGPDSQGTFTSEDCRVGLGHCRLSIIDLETGNQPLSDEDGMIQCVVTGELYDHERIRAELEAQGSVFTTKSDSEIVIHLYKHQSFNALSSLRGEFAFVLYDANRRLLFAARDRFGVKPLSYTMSDGRMLLASEVKAFPALGWKPEWDIDSIVHNGYFADDRTVFKGVRKASLMPGHFLVFRPDGSLKVQAYWDLEYATQDSLNTSTVDEMIATVRSHLTEAVRLRLRADVPVAMYLSGGIDSAAIAGIATEILREKDPAAKLTTFTLTFPYAQQFDEGPVAGRTAAFIGADVHTLALTESDLVNALDDTVWHCEQPIFSFQGPGKFLLSKFVREKGYKARESVNHHAASG
ncbi:nucleophile aminohydrolase [Mycena leptocephala]|nr:nucleophile aminohydrolase [Mycena leptocephala]